MALFPSEGHNEEGTESRHHSDLFHSGISKEIVSHVERMVDLVRNSVITCKYLWAIFPPGIDVYSHADGQDCIYGCVKGYTTARHNQRPIKTCSSWIASVLTAIARSYNLATKL